MNKLDVRRCGIAALAILAAAASGCTSSGQETLVNDPGNPGGSNSAPVITGAPPLTIVVGESYSFTPSATDADGDRLTFSIANQPSWATFDSATGELTGIPTFGEAGSYASIGISVSDGTASSALPEFQIDVTDVGNLSATLSWTPPTQNADNTPLMDLAGYKFYYGLSEGDYPNSVVVNNPGLSSYTVQNLTGNTYYFVITAINQSGAESGFSNVAMWTP